MAGVVSAGCLTPHGSAKGAPPTAVAPLPDGARIIWDGVATPRYQLTRMGPTRPWDGVGGWAACEFKFGCQARFNVGEGIGVAGGPGLQLHGEGPGWIGGGWNWAQWRGSGSFDLTRFTKLSLQVRLKALVGTATQLAGLQIALASKNSDVASPSVQLRDYEPSVLDGRWHQVIVPLSAFTPAGARSGFDLSEAWELRISTWSAGSSRFDLYLDQILALP